MVHNQIPLKESLRFSKLENGLPKGALTEISGAHGGGKTEVVLSFLAENAELKTAWIEDQFTIYPTAFSQNQVNLERVLFIEASSEKEMLWIVQQVLKSQIFGVVILSTSRNLDENNLRRLQLASEKAMAALILLSEAPTSQSSWPILVQLEVSRSLSDQNPQIQIIKYKAPQLAPFLRKVKDYGKPRSMSAL